MATRYSAKRKRVRRNRRIAAVAITVIVALITVLIVNLIANRQTLEGAKLSDSFTIENNVASVTHTETQRFYEIKIFRPDFDAEKLPEEMKTFISDSETRFRGYLETLLSEKKLSKKDKATLNISYEADSFQQFTTYTLTSDMHIANGSSENSSLTASYAVDTSTGKEYTATDIFAEDYNYEAVLASKIAAQLGDISITTLITDLDEPFTDNVFMTSEGLRIVFAQDVGDVIANGDIFTVEYKYIYYGLSFELPEEYKPPEPNPIDPKKEKVVALTFDDGPSGNVTPKLLKLLEKYDAKATFFVIGTNEKCYDYIKQAYDAGHTIGLHSFSHDYSHIYSSTDNFFEDLQKISDVVEKLTGEKSYITRFPGGSSNSISANYTEGIMTELTEMLPEKGYQYFDWNVSSGDASADDVPAETLIANSTSSNDQHIIILMHDTDEKNTTVEALPAIIEYYQAKGYEFRGLEIDSYSAHHNVFN